jgi:alpha-glucoside transport system substrate-binding protein
MSRKDAGHCWEDALAGRMTPAIEQHLASCPACERMVQGVGAAADALRERIPPPRPELDARVLYALARARGPGPASHSAPRNRSRSRRRVRGLLTRRRFAVAGSALAAAAVVAVGVVPGNGPSPSSAQPIPIGPLTATCSPDHGRLVVAGVWSGPEARGFMQVLARFERETGIRVSYAYETRDIAAMLQARIAAGCPPDVALLPQPGLLGGLARERRIQPLDRRTRALVTRNYSPGWRRLATIDSRLYGVWFKAADKSTVWYRPSAFRAAGIARTPRTWAQLLDAARTLRQRGTSPFALAGADGWTLTDWFENVFLRSAGAARYQQLAEHRIPWTHPSVIAALRELVQLIGDPVLIGDRDRQLETSFEESVARVFGPRPSAAMVFEGDFVRSFLPIATTRSAERGDGASFFPFPDASAHVHSSAVVGGDVAVAFARRAGAARLMRFLATPAAATPWARRGGFLSPNRMVDPSAYPDALTRRIAAGLVETRTIRFDLSDLQPPAFGAVARQGMWAILQHLLAEPRDVEGTARQLEAAADAAWACERANGGRC